MHSYVSAQLQAIDEGLRLLEAFVTSPLGLYSDLRMLRGSSSIQDKSAEIDRGSYKNITKKPLTLALDAIHAVEQSIQALQDLEDVEPPPLDPAWTQQILKVLVRAEQHVSNDIRKDRASKIGGLYVIVDPEVTRERSVEEIAEAALRGGARVLQLRNKVQAKGDVLTTARQLQALCESHDATFIVNDHADLAASCGSHGLHLGQHDLPLGEARRILQSWQLIGTSNALLQEALESQAQGADYIAVGSIYPTSTKEATRPAGLEALHKVKEATTSPVVAIGGITEANVEEVVRAGADCVCVVSAVSLAEDPEEASKRLVDKIESTLSRGG